jgi:hypothetical protein
VDEYGFDQGALVAGVKLVVIVVVEETIDDSFLDKFYEFDFVDMCQENEKKTEARVFDRPLDENLVMVLAVEQRVQNSINLISEHQCRDWRDCPS